MSDDKPRGDYIGPDGTPLDKVTDYTLQDAHHTIIRVMNGYTADIMDRVAAKLPGGLRDLADRLRELPVDLAVQPEYTLNRAHVGELRVALLLKVNTRPGTLRRPEIWEMVNLYREAIQEFFDEHGRRFPTGGEAVLYMREQLGLTFEEIGARIGKDKKTAWNWYQRMKAEAD